MPQVIKNIYLTKFEEQIEFITKVIDNLQKSMRK